MTQKRALSILSLALGLALGLTLSLSTGAADQASSSASPVDLTGVWTSYRDPAAPRQPGPGGRGVDMPFTELGKQKVAEYRALTQASGDSPGAHCVPYGVPAALFLGGGYPLEIIQRPEQVTMIFESHSETRRFYLQRKDDPAELVPSRDGYSTAHWDGDTLVVETTALKESIDQAYAHSDQARITERYTLVKDAQGGKLLSAELTLLDPVFYTRPVTIQFKWSPIRDHGRMMAYDCTEPAWEDYLDALRSELRKQGAGSKPAR